MEILYTPHFKRSFKVIPKGAKEKFQKQIQYLLKDLKHPFLRIKKYNRRKNIYQARIDKGYRFYFLIKKNCYILLDIMSHPK